MTLVSIFSPAQFSEPLLSWAGAHGRTLPWMTKDPYDVWLSEVMLQQTQVATILVKFPKFKSRFPSLQTLASAHVDEVLAAWSGLGYYRRARNLHACAIKLQHYVDEHGAYPQSPDIWESYPGIGKSTAHAIASACFDVVVPILDANAKRVLVRFCGDLEASPRKAWDYAYAAMKGVAPEKAALYTQAMMDLGSQVCTARKPQCTLCPLSLLCAYARNPPKEIPPSKSKASKPVIFIDWLVCEKEDQVAMVQTGSESFWPGLWQFPQMELKTSADNSVQLVQSMSHALSHRTLNIRVWQLVDGASNFLDMTHCTWVNKSAIADNMIATPTPIRRVLGL